MGRTSTIATSAALMLSLMPAATAAQRGRAAAASNRQTPESLGVHGFSVVLVVGHSQGPVTNEAVPEAARKALADMKDFLPYKRYQLLDAAWMLCCGSARAPISGRVRGPDARDYSYTIDTIDVHKIDTVGAPTQSRLNLRFTMKELQDLTPLQSLTKLSDSARLEHSRQQFEAIRERDEAQVRFQSTKQRFEVGLVNQTELESATLRMKRAEQRVDDLARLAGGASGQSGHTSGRSIMDSTFSILPGETVVIGTSRLMGDQALIALLTAATKPGGAR